MFDYSNLITEAMQYVDEKIEPINPKSIDRNRLHNRIHKQIVANIKRIALLEHDAVYKEIDYIFSTQLIEELLR